jgi:ComF family protein
MNLIKNFIDLLYPPRCLVCGRFLETLSSRVEGAFCAECLGDLTPITSPHCTICGAPFVTKEGEDHPCERCIRKPPHFEAIYSPYLYQGALMDAIHRFKYGPKNSYAKHLGPLLARFADRIIQGSNNTLLMPVPLHPKKLRQRGFNQSLLLARHVAREINSELDFLSLRRVKYTESQTGLNQDERRKNVKGAFQIVKRDAVDGKEVLLVDDVATTGHTLNECAKVLLKAGAEKVECLVLARTGNI